ncbi:hypothetical protein J1N35_034406 [Gossypium stocksii]|uniref:Aminotransferase-like plant mobile domain-containing protein n=1 Tax=Gossypium stocksii TaxID=47602 RepID=A0A9D3URY2_9ROSI|nr:hypothetical protein J1N35_034406 [Gossypium stocksii]
MANSLIHHDNNHIFVNQFQMIDTRKRIGGKVETHTFHLSCGKCTITLKDMQLQLGLPVNGSIVTQTVHADWKPICDKLLGLVLETIFEGRIKMTKLRRNFDELDKDSTEVEREQHVRAYIIVIIEAPQDINDLHPIDLQMRLDENWIRFHAEYINIWNNYYKFLPPRKAIVVPQLACDPEYMPWFRLLGKPYLLSEEDRSRQSHTMRPRWSPTYPRTQYSYTPTPMVAQTPLESLFYQGGSSSQPPIPRPNGLLVGMSTTQPPLTNHRWPPGYRHRSHRHRLSSDVGARPLQYPEPIRLLPIQ